jgi:hypothetical protein
MTCYYPLPAVKRICKQSGVIEVKVFERAKADTLGENEFKVNCGSCFGCRLERSRQWAMRCMHEAEGHTKNSFITLTYNEETMPYSLVLQDIQNFMKKLRKKYYPKKIRFYMCGEYAPVTDKYGRVLKDEKKRELKGRPHYHILLFGHDFEDKIKWKIRNGHQLYKSEKLDKIWKKGYGLIGEVTFDSAAYVARYIMKKYLGGKDIDNLDIYKGRSKEFTTMSRGGTGGLGGIGKAWIDKYGEGVYAEDRVIIKGKEVMPAKYYDKIFDMNEPEILEEVKKNRVKEALKKEDDNTQYRLITKETVKKAQTRALTRNLEKEI